MLRPIEIKNFSSGSLAARQIMKQAKHLLICGKLLLKKQIRTSLELITGEYD